MVHHHSAMLGLKFLELLLLVRIQLRSDLALGLLHNGSDALGGLDSNGFELRGRGIDNRRNLRFLFRR